jgi:hypothetical protein
MMMQQLTLHQLQLLRTMLRLLHILMLLPMMMLQQLLHILMLPLLQMLLQLLLICADTLFGILSYYDNDVLQMHYLASLLLLL